MDKTEILLQEITDAFGPSGYENAAREVMARYMKDYANISYDNLSSLERGATDGGFIHLHRAGVPTLFIGLPTRYIHSHNSIIYRKDYDNMIKLTIEVIKKLNRKTVDSLTAI